jgi:hypothetical protein
MQGKSYGMGYAGAETERAEERRIKTPRPHPWRRLHPSYLSGPPWQASTQWMKLTRQNSAPISRRAMQSSAVARHWS